MPPLLPPILTPSLIHSIRTQPNLPIHSWYLVTGVTLSILNRPDEIPQVLAHALDHGSGGVSTASEKSDTTGSKNASSPPSRAEQLIIARKMREALIKSAAIGGLPKVCVCACVLCVRSLVPSSSFQRSCNSSDPHPQNTNKTPI